MSFTYADIPLLKPFFDICAFRFSRKKTNSSIWQYMLGCESASLNAHHVPCSLYDQCIMLRYIGDWDIIIMHIMCITFFSTTLHQTVAGRI